MSIEIKDDRLYIKAFLLDSSQNLNDWGVTAASLDENINTFIGKPLVLTEAFDHPNIDDGNLQHVFSNQEPYRIGTIIDVVKSGSRYDALIEVTNEAAKSVLQSAKVPPFVSPAIYPLGGIPKDEIYVNWTGVHLAIVDDPAYSVRKAQIKDMCSGGSECLVQLRKARIEKHGYGCGFCVKNALSKLIIKTASIDASSSQFIKKESETILTDPKVVLQKAESCPEGEEWDVAEGKCMKKAAKTASLEEKIKTLEAENASLKLAKETLEASHKKIGERVEVIEKERRKERVANIVSANLIPTIFKDEAEREKEIAKLVESPHSIESIESLYAGIKSAAIKVASKQPAKFQYPNKDEQSDNSHIASYVGVS